MKSRKILTAALAMAVATVGFGVAACSDGGDNPGPTPPPEPDPVSGTFYLSTASNDWATYQTAAEIPADVKFTGDDGVYTLDVSLDAGEQFVVLNLDAPADGPIGYDALFTSLDVLTEGTDNKLVVGSTGDFSLTYDGDLMYTYTATEITITAECETTMVEGLSVPLAENFTINYPSTPFDVRWTSSDTNVFKVETGDDGYDYVETVGQGTAELIASEVNGDREVRCELTVDGYYVAIYLKEYTADCEYKTGAWGSPASVWDELAATTCAGDAATVSLNFEMNMYEYAWPSIAIVFGATQLDYDTTTLGNGGFDGDLFGVYTASGGTPNKWNSTNDDSYHDNLYFQSNSSSTTVTSYFTLTITDGAVSHVNISATAPTA